ncbi:DUF3176 domain-containing protein [Aspergillus thermomutatus]|uniref:Uncharacterized protein n=1 Tax=Aspergillus thermomutatus TaxID=41047 RepID=A0A397HF41_ASPTH|nr:uncharacterized protein CDV56_106466 [Aspergillus thermomutatus]RHZ60216.1 hypothetical protein CDV56_106466 [Aspergillus thermomutatus]
MYTQGQTYERLTAEPNFSESHGTENPQEQSNGPIELQQWAKAPLAEETEQNQPSAAPSRPSSCLEYKKDIATREYLWAMLDDWNILEISGVVISAGCLVVIVVVLQYFEGKPQPTCRYASLNSLISWVSTVSKACTLFAINAGLGQLKWVWFAKKKRPIPDLRTFDAASRGLYGSAELIWTLRGSHFAVWGSVAVILAVAFDPCVQNLIRYYPDWIYDPGQQALLANSSTYTTYGVMVNTSYYTIDGALKMNIYNALFNLDESQPWAVPRYICSSDSPFHATECVLEPVVRSLNATVRNGTYQDRSLATWNQRSSFSDNKDAALLIQPPWGAEHGIQPNQSFSIGHMAYPAMLNFFRDLFGGYFEVQTNIRDTLQALVYGNITGCATDQPDKLRCAMTNVAAAMTKTFRDSAYIQAGSDPEQSQMTVGRGVVVTYFVEVHWRWITLPGVVWSLGAVTLVGTAWKTRRSKVPNWRNDPLPLLFLYQKTDLRDFPGGSIERMGAKGSIEVGGLKVKFYGVEDKYILS